ncbi:MAG: hypothetical protein ACOYON_07860 [Fimbriimonas sp.]
MTPIIRMIALGTVLFLGGCASRSAFVGKWVGERKVDAVPGADPIIVRQLSRIKLDIQENGKFTMEDAGMPKAGTFRVETSEKGFLKVESILGRPLSEQPEMTQELHKGEIELRANADGTLTYDDPAGFEHEPVIMRPQPQPRAENSRKHE